MNPRVPAVVLVAWLAALCPAMALEGTVVGTDGAPVRGANVCYVAGGASLMCEETGKSGRFELMDTQIDTLRVSAKGFMRRSLPQTAASEPIVLVRAPVVLVRVKDASTGEPLEEGEIYVVYPKGTHVGPFPIHRNGVRIGQIEVDGEIHIRVRAKGYLAPEPRPLTVTPGKAYEVEIEVSPRPASAD